MVVWDVLVARFVVKNTLEHEHVLNYKRKKAKDASSSPKKQSKKSRAVLVRTRRFGTLMASSGILPFSIQGFVGGQAIIFLLEKTK
mmetsp:Transcript_9585/g.10601  ORF Transcript_9585/g.10601 Transcript_9585/m.10601 type:complete len:86 (-) Transcript_9585:31-288(-)